MYGSVMVNLGDDLVLTGGYENNNAKSKNLYRFSCQNEICKWETMSQQLLKGKYDHVVIPVPDDFVSCN